MYITAPEAEADSIAKSLVDEHLAACVNLVDCQSVYRWDGDVHEEDEVILITKTTEEAYPALVDRVRELHPYDVPCVERFEEGAILPRYARWIEEVVNPAK